MRLVLQGIVVFIMSLALGGVGVYLFSVFKGEKRQENTNITINLIKENTGLVDEVFDNDGVLMDQLAYSFDSDELRQKAVGIINKASVVAEIHDNRVMVEHGKAGLALDILSLAGIIPGVENFTFTDVTASEGSLDYKVQNRLATQNMLSNMIATMADGIEKARVFLVSKDIVGEIDDVKVVILRRDGVNGLNVKDLEGIKENILAMTGVESKSLIDIIDSKTGKSY